MPPCVIGAQELLTVSGEKAAKQPDRVFFSRPPEISYLMCSLDGKDLSKDQAAGDSTEVTQTAELHTTVGKYIIIIQNS